MYKLHNSIFTIGVLLFAIVPAHAAPPSTEQQAVHVLNRLANGPKPGDIDRVVKMGVQRYIDTQLNPQSLLYPPALTERLAALDSPNRSAGEVAGKFIEARKDVREQEEGATQRRREVLGAITRDTADARLLRAIDSPRQLEEVMVDFWFNHFNVHSSKGIDRALIASYERDAIRPYVFASFRDMLGATAKHPAMLYYLDNQASTAPGFVPGKKRMQADAAPFQPKGLNENYARELMELHTIGVDGGYTQKDVTELARMLTGWTYNPRALVLRNQTFVFADERHDHGVKQWLGRTVPDQGQAEGEMALDVLAQHPATARHLGFKLAQYFVQDQPPPALVDRLARSYLDSKGDIRTVLRTLFASAEFMAPEAIGAKFKTPYQYVVSAMRASGVPVSNTGPLLNTMSQLGMPLYGCQTPDGYKNTKAAWLNPDALTRRITFATALGSGKLPLASPAIDAGQLQATLGGSISGRTLTMVAANPEPLRAAMLLGSPDFMQR
ncbi:MAG: DUF1800 domain-containing protein [Pseudomonadota bacterium]